MRELVVSIAIGVACLPLWAADSAAPSIDPQEIIQKFAAKEAEFSQARNNYTYRQSVKMEELDPGGNPTGGKWELVEDIIFSPDGKRMEKVVYAPVVSLRNILLTPEDEQDLRNVQPKKLITGKRYFEGQIWVDDRDLQIVKTYGKGVGVIKHGGDNQFPKFETYREQVDGKYWFPTYTRADDTLHFKSGENQRIRMVVKYQDYKRYEGKSTIRFGDVVDDNKPSQAPAKK